MSNLYGRCFLRLMDFTPNEIYQFLSLANKLKHQKNLGKEIPYLNGKNIVLIFEKQSMRTRCSFEVAAFNQGANVTCLGSNDNSINYKESIKDTARVLGGLYNGIQYRGYDQNIIEILAQYSGIPVWNGLTDKFHPTQLLADLLTMQEQLPNIAFNNMKLAYIGYANSNISNSILEASALTGLHLRIIAPNIYWPDQSLFKQCKILAQQRGGDIILTEDISYGVKGVDFIYTDTWLSIGENKILWKERINFLRNYQVNKIMIMQTCNKKVKFLHCLPALHNNETIVSKKIMQQYDLLNGIEVTNEVFESSSSIVFKQAANRLHVIKAIMIATMVKIN